MAIYPAYVCTICTMMNFGPLTADGLRSVGEFGAPEQISTGFACWLCYCSDVAHRRPTKLCTMFGRFLGCYTIIHFRELLPPDGILPGAQFTLRPSLALHGTPAVGSSKLCGVVQGMELHNFRRGLHLYSTGRPSRWALAHILVVSILLWLFYVLY